QTNIDTPPSQYDEFNSKMFQTQEHIDTYCSVDDTPCWKTTGSLLQTILNTLPEIIFLCDTNGHFLQWNKSLEYLTAYTYDELAQMKPLDFIIATDRKRVSRIIKRVFLDKNITFKTSITTKKHQQIHMSFIITLLNDNHQTPYILGIGKDISEVQKLQDYATQKEKALEESKEQLDNIIENVNDLIQSVDANYNFVYVNNAWRKTLGYTEKEIQTLKLTDILREDQIHHCIQAFEQACRGKTMQRIETIFLTKNGKEINVEGTVNGLIQNGKFISTSAIFRDITKRKKTEEELQKAHNELQDLNQKLEKMVQERTSQIQSLLIQKDQFIGQLGHDLKTPLSILMNILPMIQETINNQDAQEDCEIAIRNVHYIKHLVIETLKIAELSSPNLILKKEKINLKNLINEVIENNNLLAKQKQIRVINIILNDIFLTIDELKIKEVIYNLINNALNFTPEGGMVTFDLHENHDNTVTIEVNDTGIGMTPKQLKRVFNDFYKADISRHDLGGSGLGLGICKRIIEKHGGKMWADSSGEGRGSQFYFTLKNN
ncbi:MAG: PAS domain-containing sensor histidine kinase, partial [Candidatus Thermoplasmatota archaeon]|nr:PAS domain-containing sensor histidine kinase [Candidatus Thermoplasmatota archaeon]